MEKANINSQNHFHQIVYDSGLGSDEWDESVGLLAREKADEVWCLREAIGPGWHLCFALPLYTSTLQNTLRGAIGPGWHLQIAIGQALMHEQYLRGGKNRSLEYLCILKFWCFSRVHICRDRWDRRSRKIFVDCVNFSVNNANCEQNLPNPHILRKHLCHFYAKCANIGQIYTYCVNICATFTQSV